MSRNCQTLFSFLRPKSIKFMFFAFIYVTFASLYNTFHSLIVDHLVIPSESIDGKQVDDVAGNHKDQRVVVKLHEEGKEDILRDLDAQLPNLPLTFLTENGIRNNGNQPCARYPTMFDLEINNVYWQIWFAGQVPVYEEVVEFKYIWHEYWSPNSPGEQQPHMMSCPFPTSHLGQIPVAVSLVEDKCDTATNALKVTYEKRTDDDKKGRFGVCVKLLRYPYDNVAVKLVEFFEVLGQLGAETVYVYAWEAHPNASKVLEHYEWLGKVDAISMTLPGNLPSLKKLLHLYLERMPLDKQISMIPYNDCLLRNMYKYEYMAMLDIDEIIMPLKSPNWKELMAALKNIKTDTQTSYASYNFRQAYFLPSMLMSHIPDGHFSDIPLHLRMLQQVYRGGNYTPPGHYVKSFHDTEEVLLTHNHFQIACLQECNSLEVPTEMGHVQHYRENCHPELLGVCDESFKNNAIRDTSIWRFKEEVISGSTRTLSKLGFFESNNNSIAFPSCRHYWLTYLKYNMYLFFISRSKPLFDFIFHWVMLYLKFLK